MAINHDACNFKLFMNAYLPSLIHTIATTLTMTRFGNKLHRLNHFDIMYTFPDEQAIEIIVLKT